VTAAETDCCTVTNMLAITLAKREKATAENIVSDSLAIAVLLGVALGVGLYSVSPWALSKIAGSSSSELVAPALSYVRIRCIPPPTPTPHTHDTPFSSCWHRPVPSQTQTGNCTAEPFGPSSMLGTDRFGVRICTRRCFGLPAALVIFVAQAVFLAALDPLTPLLAAAVAGLGNLGADLLLVNVFGLGIVGAALATAGAQVRLSHKKRVEKRLS
jgi:ABC-type dipeptide/oligopeptide/nickel transport system permease subunit